MDLIAAMAAANPGDTIELQDGIYHLDGITTLGPASTPDNPTTITAASGARPIITTTDGYPPAISILSGVTVSGIWFGGTRPTEVSGSKTITPGSGCIVEDCTLFGYINGIQNGSDAHANIYRRNRFVNCGYQRLSHPIYIANLNSAGPEDGCLVEECICVGCQGYSIHLYHEPSYGLAQYNFIGAALYGLALQGDQQGPVSGNRNIIWSATNAPLYYNTTTSNLDHNVWGADIVESINPGTLSEVRTMEANYFVSPTPTKGTNPVVWQETDVVANLGTSSAVIDAAIAALITKFGQTTQQIHDDATIEAEFTTLKSVIDTWKLIP